MEIATIETIIKNKNADMKGLFFMIFQNDHFPLFISPTPQTSGSGTLPQSNALSRLPPGSEYLLGYCRH